MCYKLKQGAELNFWVCLLKQSAVCTIIEVELGGDFING